MFSELDPLLHSALRLAVMSVLLGVESADFVFLREQTGATAGNLSVQLDKLAKAGYITVEKCFRGIRRRARNVHPEVTRRIRKREAEAPQGPCFPLYYIIKTTRWRKVSR